MKEKKEKEEKERKENETKRMIQNLKPEKAKKA